MNIKIPYDQILEKIAEKSGLDQSEIESKIKDKLSQLSGLISKEGAAHIIANELGVKLINQENITGSVKIKDLLVGMRNIEILSKVLTVYEVREFQRQNGDPGKVGSCMIADDTGKSRLVGWGSVADEIGKVQAGDFLKIKNAYVKENQNGFKEIHLNDNSAIVLNPPEETVEVTEQATPQNSRKKISDLEENDSGVELLGHIVQAFDPKYYEVCPECNKRIKSDSAEYVCPVHGSVEPAFGYLLNFVLDDGSENIRVVCFRDAVISLLGVSKEDMDNFRLEPEKFTEIKNKILGNMIKIQGRVSKNDYFDRMEFVAFSVDSEPKAEEELANL